MLVFIALLALVLIYEWRSGALDWGNKIRVGLSQAQAKEKARKTAEEKL